jgi:hypothetical protein
MADILFFGLRRGGLGKGMKNDFACDSILLRLNYEGAGYAEIRGLCHWCSKDLPESRYAYIILPKQLHFHGLHILLHLPQDENHFIWWL